MLKEQTPEMELLLKRLPALNEYFELHNKVGQGTFSTVYLATLRNSPSTQKYAVKHLKQVCEHSKIQNELRCLQEIGGKDNVVPAELCLTNGDDCVTFIMPYLPHVSFSNYVAEMDAEETRLYMKNLFIALKRVHSFNIIHRDVKPSNFLYNRETKQFLLVDFGLAENVRVPNKAFSKELFPTNENEPLDYSKKRKRSSESNDEEDKNTPFKLSKRIVLKTKDSNVKLSPSKPFCENIKTPESAVTREEENLKSPVKSSVYKSELNETPLKSRVSNVANVPSSSRRKLLDCVDENTLKMGEGLESLKTQNSDAIKFLQSSNKLTRGKSFTPLVSTKSSIGTFVQVKNSRVVRHHSMPSCSKASPSPSPSVSTIQPCPCSGIGAICSLCSTKKVMYAPIAGTSGFRPPEVLFRYLYQTTAVDMWAAGVILLCILSGCYPFFSSSPDLVSLAEIMTIFGTERTIQVAKKFGRRIVCSERKKGVDLKKLCIRLRERPKKRSKTERSSSNEPKCRDCLQTIKKDGCLCPSDEESESSESSSCRFPDSAFDLLKRLLDLDPTTRITAAEALEHPFITG